MISINFKTDDIPPIKFPYHLHLLPTERLTSSNIGETDSFEKCDELIFFDPKQSVLDNLIIQKPNLRTSMTEKLLKPCPLEELTQILCSGIKQVDSDSVRLEEKLLREEYQTKCYKLILKERKRTRRSGMKDVHTSAIEITDRDLEDEVLAGPLTEKEKISTMVEEHTVPAPGAVKKKPASFLSATTNIVNTIVGAGTLGLPFAFAKAGFLPALLIYVFMLAVSYLSLDYLVEVADAIGVYSLGDMAAKLFGIYGILAVAICTFIKCFGVLWSYTILAVDFAISLILGFGADPNAFYVSRWFLSLIIAFFIFQPLSWFRRVDSLKIVSGFALLAMILCVVIVFFRFIVPYEIPPKPSMSPEVVHPSVTIIQTFSTLCFAFGSQQTIPMIQNEVRRKSAKTMRGVVIVSLGTVTVIYLFSAIFGYIQFTDLFFTASSPGNILTMYEDGDPLLMVGRAAVMLSMLLSHPLLLMPARSVLFNMIRVLIDLARDGKAKTTRKYAASGIPLLFPPRWRHNYLLCHSKVSKMSLATGVVGSILTFAAMGLAIILPSVSFVFDIIGSTAGTAVSFIIPTLMYIRLKTKPDLFVNKDRVKVLLENETPEEPTESKKTEKDSNDKQLKELAQNAASEDLKDMEMASMPGSDNNSQNAAESAGEDEQSEEMSEEEARGGKPQRRYMIEPDDYSSWNRPGDTTAAEGSHGIAGLNPQSMRSYATTPSGIPLLSAISPMPGSMNTPYPVPSPTSTLPLIPEDETQANSNAEEKPTTGPNNTSSSLSPSDLKSEDKKGANTLNQTETNSRKSGKKSEKESEELAAFKKECEAKIAEYLVPLKMSHHSIITALVILITGVVIGLVSLAVAIIYDTSIKDKLNL
eukprot:MONOS_202.2-p1 / transcript=MONOS_202.2 / gene=MONOS_202 / organism=Monocercomonoides_exilis_PA203 / gene_product=AminoAcid/AuxinPermease(AAAP) Family Protein / transcript_product=AminoAcid/AuxinPermease(AAAP) Family Protein / location=Mono_scaffold00003:244646-247749(+) / protein_length=869 / sequence_SO=supercontig / SO=protein_coding / is_pseudo=false